MQGRTVGLRAVNPNDYSTLYRIVSGTTTWRNLASTVPPEEFSTFVWSGVFAQFVVYYQGDPSGCVGLVSIINIDAANQVGYLSIVMDPQAPSTAAAEATLLLLEHIFANSGLRKVYAETTTRSFVLVETAQRWPGVRIEARLGDHLLIGGQAHDLFILAIYRDEFLAGARRTLDFVHREPSAHPEERVVAWSDFIGAMSAEFPELAVTASSDGGVSLMNDLGLDSLTLIEVVAWIEEAFGVMADEEELLRLVCLQDLYQLIDPSQTLTRA